jgi:hypothetical protein
MKCCTEARSEGLERMDRIRIPRRALRIKFKGKRPMG